MEHSTCRGYPWKFDFFFLIIHTVLIEDDKSNILLVGSRDDLSVRLYAYNNDTIAIQNKYYL